MKPKIHIPGTTTKSYNSLMKRTFIPAWLAAMSLVLVQCAKVEVTEPQKPSVSGETVTLTVRSEAPLTKTSIEDRAGILERWGLYHCQWRIIRSDSRH